MKTLPAKRHHDNSRIHGKMTRDHKMGEPDIYGILE